MSAHVLTSHPGRVFLENDAGGVLDLQQVIYIHRVTPPSFMCQRSRIYSRMPEVCMGSAAAISSGLLERIGLDDDHAAMRRIRTLLKHGASAEHNALLL